MAKSAHDVCHNFPNLQYPLFVNLISPLSFWFYTHLCWSNFLKILIIPNITSISRLKAHYITMIRLGVFLRTVTRPRDGASSWSKTKLAMTYCSHFSTFLRTVPSGLHGLEESICVETVHTRIQYENCGCILIYGCMCIYIYYCTKTYLFSWLGHTLGQRFITQRGSSCNCSLQTIVGGKIPFVGYIYVIYSLLLCLYKSIYVIYIDIHLTAWHCFSKLPWNQERQANTQEQPHTTHDQILWSVLTPVHLFNPSIGLAWDIGSEIHSDQVSQWNYTLSISQPLYLKSLDIERYCL